jgi:hypothetical protein
MIASGRAESHRDSSADAGDRISRALAEHLRGRIETFALADLLQWLEVKRASGRLTLGRGEDRKTIDWKDGDIVYVSGTRPGDRLGHALAASREVPAAALYGALAKNFAGRANLTRLFLEENLISKDRLASIVEHLARRLLREALSWRRGRFDFDPEYKTEDLLQIHLKLKSQVVAFQAAKDMDDSARGRAPAAPEEAEDESWEKAFRLETIDEAFWEVQIRTDNGSSDAEKMKGQYALFRRLAQVLHSQLAARTGFLSIYEDSAHYVADLLSLGDVSSKTVERLLGVINLDPFFTMNLLHLANALNSRPAEAVSSARLALQKIGFEAFQALIGCLRDGSRPHLSSSQPIHRALRRAGLSAAIVARGGTSDTDADPEEAYAAGLLHAVAYTELLEAAHSVELPPGPFRAAAIEHFRPVVGKVRSAARGLPPPLAEVHSDDGSDTESPLVRAVRAARTAFPACAVGPIPGSAGLPPGAEAIDEVRRVFEFLDLGTP